MAGRAKYVPLFESFWQALQALSEEERLLAYDSMCRYAFEGEYPDFTDRPMLAMFWELARPNIDAALKRSEINRENIMKRWDKKQK